KFPSGKHLWPAINKELTPHRVEHEIAELKREPKQLTRTPEKCFEPRDQLLDGKRLHEIVVRSCPEARNPVIHPVPRGEDQHRNGILPGSQRAKHSEAIAVGKAQIENNRGIMR